MHWLTKYKQRSKSANSINYYKDNDINYKLTDLQKRLIAELENSSKSKREEYNRIYMGIDSKDSSVTE